MTPLPFVAASAEPASKPASAGRLINLYAEPNPPGAKYPYTLYGIPGRRAFTTIGTGPIRDAIRLDEIWYVVSGKELYAIKSDASSVLLGEVGTAGGVFMAASKTQVAIVAGGLGYIATATSLTQITDADFPADVASVTHLDGYFIWTIKDSGKWVWSDLNDGLNYTGTNFKNNEAHWDNTVRVLATRRELLFFGGKTTEIWYNAGGSSTFARLPGGVLAKGASSAKSAVEVNTTVLFVGDDYIVWQGGVGANMQRVSTYAVEKDLAKRTDIVAFSYAQRGHIWYVLKVPGVTTWAYDLTTGFWHERKTQGSSVWQPDYAAEIWNKVMVAGGMTVTELDPDTLDENGKEITGTAITAPIYNGAEQFTLPAVQMDMETGVGLATGQGSDPQIMMRISKNGGRTYGNQRFRSFGKVGKYEKRAIWYRNGRAREFTLEFTVSDPVRRGLMGAYGTSA